MNLYIPSDETVELVRKEFKLNDRKIKEALDHLKQWLEMQPHLPNTEEDSRLERWLINCKNNLEKTKETIDIYYSLKTLSPEIMTGRDSTKPWFNDILNRGFSATMPQLTPEGDRISVHGLYSEDVSNFVMEDLMRLMLMYMDVKLLEDYYLRNIFIMDMKDLSVTHVMKTPPALMKKYILFITKGHKARIKSIHFINAPAFVDLVMVLIKPLLSKKIVSRIQIHGSDYTKLYNDVPRHLLPTELGGESGSIKEHYEQFQDSIKSHHEWFMATENLKADESKRPKGQVSCNEMFGIEGSFRNLEVD